MNPITIKLSEVTPAIKQQIPYHISDGMSQFRLEDADISLFVKITLSKKVDFYKAMRAFRKLAHDRLMASLRTMGSNRVHPFDAQALDHAIVVALRAEAEAFAKGKTYQFYRVVLVFEQIYDKPQTCCCGLMGFSGYDLYKQGNEARELINKAISQHAGVVQSNHALFIDLDKKDSIDHHGNLV